MLILSIVYMISIGASCRTSSEVELVPFESRNFIVQFLPNGNVEVKADFIQAHFDLLIKAVILKKENTILKNRLAEVGDAGD